LWRSSSLRESQCTLCLTGATAPVFSNLVSSCEQPRLIYSHVAIFQKTEPHSHCQMTVHSMSCE
jgi:hypothetical protein